MGAEAGGPGCAARFDDVTGNGVAGIASVSVGAEAGGRAVLPDLMTLLVLGRKRQSCCKSGGMLHRTITIRSALVLPNNLENVARSNDQRQAHEKDMGVMVRGGFSLEF